MRARLAVPEQAKTREGVASIPAIRKMIHSARGRTMQTIVHRHKPPRHSRVESRAVRAQSTSETCNLINRSLVGLCHAAVSTVFINAYASSARFLRFLELSQTTRPNFRATKPRVSARDSPQIRLRKLPEVNVKLAIRSCLLEQRLRCSLKRDRLLSILMFGSTSTNHWRLLSNRTLSLCCHSS